MPNQYKNKVVYGDSVLMDITDTTAEAGDVASGAVFYAKNGARTVGTFVQAQSDWDENDTTDPAYVLNRTHSKASIGNYYQLDLINAYNSKYASTETIEPIGKTYTYYHFIDGIGNPYLLGFDEIDTTATSAKLIVNDIENNLSCLYSETVEDYDKVFYCYNNDFCIAVYLNEDSYSYEAYGYFYTNIDIDVSSIIFYLPSLAEQYTYNKLDNNYLNGLLITKGNGAGAEIFNAQNVRNSSTANGSCAHAEGADTHANGIDSHTEGYNTTADGSSSHAEGSSTYAYGSNSHSEGQHTRAIGAWSHAEGSGDFLNIYLTGEAGATTYTVSRTLIDSENKIQGSLIDDDDHWRIVNVTATNDVIQTITLSETLSDTAISDERYYIYIGSAAFGQSSHAEGHRTTASGMFSHSEGGNTIAKGSFGAHAEGYCTKAYSNYQHVQGRYNIADSNNTYADIVGNGTTNNKRSNAYTLDWSGNGWFAGKVSAGTIETPASVTHSNNLTTKEYVDNAINRADQNKQGSAIYGSANVGDDNFITPFSVALYTTDDGHRDVIVTYTDSTYGILHFSSWSVAASFGGIVSNAILYYNSELLCATLFGFTSASVSPSEAWIFTVYSLQRALTFDSAPISYSKNPVTSGGIYTALSGKANNADIPSASSSTPLADGAAAAGTSTAYARADHVHPKITQTISMSNNVITLTGSDGSTSSVTLPVYDGTVTSGGGS